MASAGTRAATAAALLFLSSAVVVILLQAPRRRPGLAAGADLLVSALDRVLDGRGGLLELLATRRNMILLCHAILLLILRDAGVLASRRSRSPGGPGEAETATAVFVVAQMAAPAPALPHATRTAVPVPARPAHATRSAVVWRRRPRNRAATAAAAPMHEHDASAARRLVECQPAAEETWAATTGPPAVQAGADTAAVAAKQMVLVESPRNDDHHGRAATVAPVEHPRAIATDGERGDDRRIIAVADDDKERMDDTAREHEAAGMEMELADDRAFEEFIESQRRQMRQESLKLQLVSYQATAACY